MKINILFNKLKAVNKKKVVKDFTATAGFNLALRPIELVKSFFVAKYLGPADYGILKLIELIQQLNKYGSLGFKPVAMREIGAAIGEKDIEKENHMRNITYSAELLLSVILFIIGTSSSLFFDSKKITILIILASFGLLFNKLSGILGIEATVQKKFVLIGKISFLSGLISSIIIIIIVPFLKIYSVMLMNILIGAFSCFLYLKTLKIDYSFRINFLELKSLLSISIPFMFITLSNGSYLYAERILLVKYIGINALGFYGFGMMIINQLMTLLKSAIKVRRQDIYELLSANKKQQVHTIVLRETALICISAVLIIPVLWLLIDMAVPIILPKWSGGIFYFKLILIILPLKIIDSYPAAVLSSNYVNKQNVITLVRVSGTITLTTFTIMLEYYGKLDLTSFIVLSIIGYSVHYLPILFFYRKYFYKNIRITEK